MRKIRGRGRLAGIRSVPRCYDAVVKLWVLRLLVPLGGHKILITERGICEDDIATFVGLQVRGEEFHPLKHREALFQKHELVEARGPSIPAGTTLARNIQWLGSTVGLSQVEMDILHFVVLQTHHPVLAKTLEILGGLNLAALQLLFTKLLGLPQEEVRSALNASGALSRSGLISFDLQNRWNFASKVETLPGISDHLGIKLTDRTRLFAQNFVTAPAPKLKLEDFPHAGEDSALIERYLRDALQARSKGVNVLIHGIPGSGKTEFVRMLAHRLGGHLFEIATENPDGEPREGKTRFRSYRLSQSILAQVPNQLVLFDEVEDVFQEKTESHSEHRGNQSGIKAWVNRILESNPVPAFWITNAHASIDPAFIRRFDYVMELNIPPRSVRAKVLDGYLDGLAVDDQWKAAMANHEALAPALVERAAKVVRRVKQADPSLNAGKALSRILGNTLEAMGARREPAHQVVCVTRYRPEILNTDCDLLATTEGLRTHRQGRLCLYGPPGTGKTAFGRHLSEVLDRPLLIKRASDLLNPYVGMTERLTAAMFREAHEEGAMLLLDEADSFLQDRQGAQRSWEVTQVNEMLTQMEAFNGIFIASTNLMGSLDPAALRRFDLKIRFDWLKPDQAWQMFQDAAASLGFEAEESLHPAMRHLSRLTPGDVATTIRQSRLRPILDALDLLERLRGEVAAKPEGRRQSLGFTA